MASWALMSPFWNKNTVLSSWMLFWTKNPKMSLVELSTLLWIRGRVSVTLGERMSLDNAVRQQARKLQKFMRHNQSTSISITNLWSRVSQLVANTQVSLIKLEDFLSVAKMIKVNWASVTIIMNWLRFTSNESQIKSKRLHVVMPILWSWHRMVRYTLWVRIIKDN